MIKSLRTNLSLGTNALRDWKIICTVFVVIIFIVLAADIYLFYGDYRSLGDNDISQTDYPNLDKTRLGRVVGGWQAREVRFNNILDQKGGVIDPSL